MNEHDDNHKQKKNDGLNSQVLGETIKNEIILVV